MGKKYEMGPVSNRLYSFYGDQQVNTIGDGGRINNTTSNAIINQTVKDWNDGNTQAGISLANNVLSGSGGSGGVNVNNIIGKGAGLAAEQLAPGSGQIVAPVVSFIADLVGGSGKWKDDRAGERTAAGWGKPLSSFSGLKFTFQGRKFEMQPTWQEGATETGYPLLMDGVQIGLFKYVWVENNSLFVQGALAPWDTDKTGGRLQRLKEVPTAPHRFYLLNEWGTEPQPKAFTGLNVIEDQPIQKKSAEAGGGSQPSVIISGGGNGLLPQNIYTGGTGNTFTPAGGTPVSMGGGNSSNIIPGNTVDWNNTGGANNSSTDTSNGKKTEEKKDNTTLFVRLGIGLVLVILLLVFIFKK